MSKRTFGIFDRVGKKYGWSDTEDRLLSSHELNREYIAQLPEDADMLCSGYYNHCHVYSDGLSFEDGDFILGLLERVNQYITTITEEEQARRDRKGLKIAPEFDFGSKINAVLAFAQFLESGGYFKVVFADKLSRKKGWGALANGRLAQLFCSYLKGIREIHSIKDANDYNTSLGRMIAVNKWKETIISQVKVDGKIRQRYDDYLSKEKWTEHHTMQFIRKNLSSASIVIPEGYSEIKSIALKGCMDEVKEIRVESDIDQINLDEFSSPKFPNLERVVAPEKILHEMRAGLTKNLGKEVTSQIEFVSYADWLRSEQGGLNEGPKLSQLAQESLLMRARSSSSRAAGENPNRGVDLTKLAK